MLNKTHLRLSNLSSQTLDEFVLTRWHEQVHDRKSNRQNRQNSQGRRYDISSPIIQAGCSSGHVRAPSSRVYSFYPNEV